MRLTSLRFLTMPKFMTPCKIESEVINNEQGFETLSVLRQ